MAETATPAHAPVVVSRPAWPAEVRISANRLVITVLVTGICLFTLALEHGQGGWAALALGLGLMSPVPMVLSRKRNRIDPTEGAFYADGKRHPLSHAYAVVISESGERVTGPDGEPTAVLLYQISFAAAEQPARAELEQHVRVLREGSSRVPQRAQRRMSEQVLHTAITLGEYEGLGRAHSLACALARQLERPLVDATVPPVEVRLPEELDTPLQTQLRTFPGIAPDPGDPPNRCHLTQRTDEDGDLVVRWEDEEETSHELTASHERIRVDGKTIRVAQLSRILWGRNLPSVVFVSQGHAVRIRFPHDDAARWVVQRLRWFLRPAV